MREVFEEIFRGQAGDPMEAARRAMRPALRRRFYANAGVREEPEGFAVVLDGRSVRTPGGRSLAAPSGALAEALAAEWQAQTEVIDPARMPLTRLAHTIIDGVADTRNAVREEIGKYLGSDLVFYRAEGPEGLVTAQARHWDPVVEWARHTLGARFMLSQGVVFVEQPQRALAAAQEVIPDDAWLLGAVHSITTLTGSALLALAILRKRLSAEEAWAAAHVDEDWQMAQWGTDELAMQRRAFHRADMQAAATVLRLLG